VDKISNEHLLEAIKHEIFLKRPKNIMESMQSSHHIQANNRATHKYTTRTYEKNKDQFVPHTETLPQPTWIS